VKGGGDHRSNNVHGYFSFSDTVALIFFFEAQPETKPEKVSLS